MHATAPKIEWNFLFSSPAREFSFMFFLSSFETQRTKKQHHMVQFRRLFLFSSSLSGLRDETFFFSSRFSFNTQKAKTERKFKTHGETTAFAGETWKSTESTSGIFFTFSLSSFVPEAEKVIR
jgi:hypothetical protein